MPELQLGKNKEKKTHQQQPPKKNPQTKPKLEGKRIRKIIVNDVVKSLSVNLFR